MILLYLKPLHVIFMVSWFAALFFLGRMYIYHLEALQNKPPDQSIITLCINAERRILYIILYPSILLTTIFGFALVYYTGAFKEGWLHFKLMLIFAFFYYNYFLIKFRNKLLKPKHLPPSWKMRLMNEVPFLFLVGISFTVYMKSTFSSLWAILVVILIIIVSVMVNRLIKKFK